MKDGPEKGQTVGMEFSFILTQVRKAAEILEVGAVQEIAIRTGALTMLIRVVSPARDRRDIAPGVPVLLRRRL